ncbi:EpsG family protein [Clostridium sardiniense]|uniref:EpsG family protein n=1 Tax=Clostridium sardiniense TaxID=29369 RepID=UPI003D34332E
MISTLISTYILALLSRLMEGRKKYIQSKYFLVILAIVLILIAGLRTNIGDTGTYIRSYIDFEGKTLSEALENKGDWGFYLFTYYIYQISSNPQVMIFINALITQILYLRFFLRYKSLLELEVFMYISSGYYFVTMNGIRQSLAAGIIMIGTKYIISGNFKKFFIIIVAASIFHQSALIMIPIYFISRMKPWSKKIFIMIGIAVVGTILFYELLPILERILQGTNYEHYIKVFQEGTEQGANILRVLVAAVPLVLAYIRRKDLEDSSFNRVFINMSVINFVFMLFSLQTWIFARFTMYFNMFNFILLPSVISSWKSNKEKRLLYILFIICYLLFFMKEQMTAERIRFYKF